MKIEVYRHFAEIGLKDIQKKIIADNCFDSNLMNKKIKNWEKGKKFCKSTATRNKRRR